MRRLRGCKARRPAVHRPAWQRLAFSPNGSPLVWSPDGSKLAFSEGADLFVVLRDGSDLTRVPLAPSGCYQSSVSDPAWSPDGTKLLYRGHGRICAVRLDGSGEVVLIGPG